MAATNEQKPGQMIVDYMKDVEEETSLWDNVTENLTKFWDGLCFSIGLDRYRTWIMLFFTFLATLFCSEVFLDISWDTSLAVVAVGTVFPVVFSIQAAYVNREKALKYLDDVKSSFVYMYFTFGEWDKLHGGNTQPEAEEVMVKLAVDMMKVLRAESFGGKARESVHVVYDGFQKLLVCAHQNTKVPPPWVNGMAMSIRVAMSGFESTKTIKDYETPRGLRKLCYFLIITTPILLAPYWAHFCTDNPDELEYGCVASYFVGLLYVIITSTLLHVQEALEDPFDGDGDDDINWEHFACQLDRLPQHGKDGPKMREEAAQQEESYQASA